MISIYNVDGKTIKKVPVTRNAVHEEELMSSNFVKLSWKDKNGTILPAGSYITPYEDELDASGRPVRYFLLENYSPTAEKENRFTYEPQFQHPVMWLTKIPFIYLSGDTTEWDKTIKNFDWSYIGPAGTIARRIAEFINFWCDVDRDFGAVFGNGWTALASEALPATATCTFSANDVFSAAGVIANAFECEFHFNFETKQFILGNIGSTPSITLKTGENVGVANISRTKKEYYNRYVVLGGTKNMTQQTASGDNVQLTTRLTLDEEQYTDSIIDLRGPTSNEPMMTGQLIFDDIYPKLELYIYNPRERICWLLDDNDEKVEDSEGLLDPVTEKRYKYYSKWYVRLAYKLTAPLQNKETLNIETVEGVTYFWYEFAMSEDLRVADRQLAILFQANANAKKYTSPLTSREFDVVWYSEANPEREVNKDDVDPNGFQPLQGDYRIEFDESSGMIIPTSSSAGMCPQGAELPTWENNKVTLVNIALDSSYKKAAQDELYIAAERKINFLRSDLNTYTFPSNPLLFKLDNPHLYIGQGVRYDDGQDLNGSSSYVLDTHIRKLVTRLDDPNIQEISVGNEKVKGNISTMKEQIESIIAGGFGVGGGALTESQFMSLLRNYGSKLFLSKVKADRAQEKITFLKGADFGANGAWGYIREVITDGVAEIIAWFKNLKADVLQVLDYIKGPLDIKGGDVTVSKDEGGNGGDLHVEGDVDAENLNVRDSITTNNLTVTGLAHFFELVIDKLRASGGAQIYTCADGFAVQDVVTNDSYVYLYWRATDGDRKIKNMWERGDQAICMNFNEVTEAGTYSNVSHKFYWSVVADKGTEVHRFSLGDGEYEDVDAHFIKIYSGSEISLNKNTVNGNYVGTPGSAAIGDEIAMLGSRATTADATQRKVAVYLSAYSSYDLGNDTHSPLVAPFLAFYKGLNNFDLGGHRTTYIDANGSEFRGNFYVTGANGDVDINTLFSGSEIDIIFGYGNPNTVSKPHENWSDAEKLAKVEKVLYYDLDEEPASEGGRLYKWVYQQANAETGTEAGYLWVSVTDIDTTAALDHIRDVASDGKLSGGSEKLRVFLDWTDAKRTCTSLMAQAVENDRHINTDNTNTYDGVHTYKSAYDGIVKTFNDLSTYLNNKVSFTIESEGYPAWIDPSNVQTGINVTTVLPPWTEYDETFTTGAIAYRTLWMNFYAAAVELTRAINAYQFQLIDEMGDDGLLDIAEKTALREIFAGEVRHYFEMMDEAASYGVDNNGDFTGEYVDDQENTQVLDDLVGAELSHLGSYLDGVLAGSLTPTPSTPGQRPQTLPQDTWVVNENMRGGLTEEGKPANITTSPLPDKRSGYPLWLLRETLTKEEVIDDEVWDNYWMYYRNARAAMEDTLRRAREKSQEDSGPVIFVTNTPTALSMPTPPPYKVGDIWYEQVYLDKPNSTEKQELDDNNNPFYNEYVCWNPYNGSTPPSYSDKLSYWRLVKAAMMVEFIVDKKNGEIISRITNAEGKLSEIRQDVDSISSTVSKLGASRNMLLNGDFSAVSSGTSLANFAATTTSGMAFSQNTTYKAEGFNFSAYLNITSTSGTSTRGFRMPTSLQPCLLLKSGVKYTLSVYVMSQTSNNVISVYRDGNAIGDMTNSSGQTHIVSGTWTRVQFTMTGDGYAKAISIVPRTNAHGATMGSFYFCGIQLEEGEEVTAWMAGEDNTGVLESQISQTAEEIKLYVKKGDKVGGIKIQDSGCTLYGAKTTIEGDLDIKGLITNSASFIDCSDDNNLIHFVNINLSSVKNVVIRTQPDDVNETPPCPVSVLLPTTTAVSLGSVSTVALNRSGVMLSITHEVSMRLRDWNKSFTFDGTAAQKMTIAGRWDGSLAIVADARVLTLSNYTGTQVVPPCGYDPIIFNEAIQNIFVCNGYYGKILMLPPGQSVTLMSSIEVYNNVTYLAWYVQNGGQFDAVKAQVAVKVNNEIKEYSSTNDHYNPTVVFAPPSLSADINVDLLYFEIGESGFNRTWGFV